MVSRLLCEKWPDVCFQSRSRILQLTFSAFGTHAEIDRDLPVRQPTPNLAKLGAGRVDQRISSLDPAIGERAVGQFSREAASGHPAAAPLNALERIGGKRKPREGQSCGASRTGNLGEGIGGVVSCPLTQDNGAGWIRFRGQVNNSGSLAMMRRASSRVSSFDRDQCRKTAGDYRWHTRAHRGGRSWPSLTTRLRSRPPAPRLWAIPVCRSLCTGAPTPDTAFRGLLPKIPRKTATSMSR